MPLGDGRPGDERTLGGTSLRLLHGVAGLEDGPESQGGAEVEATGAPSAVPPFLIRVYPDGLSGSESCSPLLSPIPLLRDSTHFLLPFAEGRRARGPGDTHGDPSPSLFSSSNGKGGPGADEGRVPQSTGGRLCSHVCAELPPGPAHVPSAVGHTSCGNGSFPPPQLWGPTLHPHSLRSL